MHLLRQRVNVFLEKYGMSTSDIDLQKNCDIFIEEMKRGLDAESSLLMLPTYIGMESELPLMERVIAIDAGGTNFRVALIYFDKAKKPVIEYFKNYPMPGTQGEITKEEFFNTIYEYIRPILSKSNKISFCFSYATVILPDKDGRLIKFSKEVKVSGVDGELIGNNLKDTLKKHGCTEDKDVIILNDTVATLLAGRAAYPDRLFDGYIGFILGTGTNMCYMERCENIGKIPQMKQNESSILINIESGAYNKAPFSPIDHEFDNTTANPGHFPFEKTVSGAYQGGLMLTAIKKACDEHVFSEQMARAVDDIDALSSIEIDDFLNYPYDENILAKCCSKAQGDDDRAMLYYLVDGVIERTAKFIAFSLTAVMEKAGKGRNPCKPICITADGSTFHKSKLFRTKLDYYIKTFTNNAKGIYCEFVKVDQGTLIGAAIGGLLN